MVTIVLTSAELLKVARPLGQPSKKWGGFQRVIHRLQAGLRVDSARGPLLTMTDKDAERVVRYSHPKYGSGTYQTVLRSIEHKVRSAMERASGEGNAG